MAWLRRILTTHSTNLVIILVMMQASKKVPFEDPNVLNGVRALYVLSNVIIAAIYIYVGMQIDKKKGKRNKARGKTTYTDIPLAQIGLSSNTSNQRRWAAPRSPKPLPPLSKRTTNSSCAAFTRRNSWASA